MDRSHASWSDLYFALRLCEIGAWCLSLVSTAEDIAVAVAQHRDGLEVLDVLCVEEGVRALVLAHTGGVQDDTGTDACQGQPRLGFPSGQRRGIDVLRASDTLAQDHPAFAVLAQASIGGLQRVLSDVAGRRLLRARVGRANAVGGACRRVGGR